MSFLATFKLALVSLLILCASCHLSEVTVAKRQRLYAYVAAKDDGNVKIPGAGKLSVYQTKAAVVATLKEDGDAVYIRIKKADSLRIINMDSALTISIPSSPSFQTIPLAKGASVAPKYYFSSAEAEWITPKSKPKTTKANTTKTNTETDYFHYQQWRVYVQAMAIPLKFRRSLDAIPAQGATPAQAAVHAQVETGPSIALAPGFKHSWNSYRGTKNVLGSTTSSFSLAGGALLGLGVVDINAKSTQGRVLDTNASRNAIIPVGLHFVVGINNLNAGIAGGWDIITGPNSSDWNYHGKFWTGVIVGIDIIK